VGTTSLDAGRPVIWDITRIAASGSPQAASLIHDVVLASACVPAVFPPVLTEVDAEGRRYDEMQVDGGVTAQPFFSPASASRDVRRHSRSLASAIIAPGVALPGFSRLRTISVY
jgi:predicted acylesterase/phospholipase RssA